MHNIQFRKLMFRLVELPHASSVYMTTTHGRAILLCMNVLMHDQETKMAISFPEHARSQFSGGHECKVYSVYLGCLFLVVNLRL